jgi:hypothetical protein
MAIVERPINNENHPPLTGKCGICGKNDAVAFWMPISCDCWEVCEECAKEKLPLLIADAVSTSLVKLPFEYAERALETVAKQFWYGLAIAQKRNTSKVGT